MAHYILATDEQKELGKGTEDIVRDLLRSLGYEVEWVEFDGAHSYHSMNEGIREAVKWLPLENEFAVNDPYYGPNADLGFNNFNGWRVYCNIEAEKKNREDSFHGSL